MAVNLFQRGKSKALLQSMEKAEDYAQWSEFAAAWDHEQGLDDWKQDDACESYDYRSIRQRLDILRDLRFRKDWHQLLFVLNEGVHGNLGGIGKPSLYNKARLGTKNLITRYIDELCGALNDLNEVDDEIVPLAEKQDFFLRASHCNGRTALMLSGGAVLGFFHTGVLKALFDQGLLPEIISGSSAGSILAATACTHPDVELRERLSLDNLHHEVEETTAIRPSLTLFGGSRAMDVDNLRDYLAKIIPDMTFQEAFELTGRKLNITVTGLSTQQAPRLLNAITSPNVLIRSAVMASCAIYGIYPPVTLMCRNAAGETVPYLPGMKWIDGSFADDLPAKRLARLYGVNHFISSMTNPAALAITPDPDAPRSRLRNLAHFQARFLKLGAAEAMRFTRDNVRIKSPVINLMQHLTYGVLAQEYTADINIFLRNRWDHPLRLLAPPTREAMHRLIHEGERSAWEKVEMVRNCTAVSRTLDSILHTRGWEK
ncbi:MAG: patatin [Pseudomonas sp.]|nr:patatin [Pseudomonas sp.]MBB51092.1 patatin [Pseudomonadales bacterium]MBU31621.1 patatin [Pseudomonadales bacterium]|tara:strand:+ start:1080 stop:2537 length:1458 start_codon:yes stop_codon:yes gene_type:complete